MPRGIPNHAKNSPVFKSTGLETAELPIGRTERTAPTPDNPVGAAVLVAVAERMPDQEKLANLAFMNEQVFEINVNGKNFFFRRGETKTVPRYVVDHMARMKVTAYTDKEVFNSEGVKQIMHVPHTGMKYDFAMVRDDNPMGENWLKATLAMGG